MTPTPKNCRTCGHRLGAGNRHGYCHRCAMKEHGRQRAEVNANFKKLVQACRDAGPEAAERLCELLEEQRHTSDQSLTEMHAELTGPSMTARLSENLTREKIERAWQLEQYATGLPTIAVDVRGGVVHLTYCTGTLQEITTDDVKRHFQSAIQRGHPNTQIEWLYARPDPQEPNQETK